MRPGSREGHTAAEAGGAQPPAKPSGWAARRLHFVGIGGCGMSGLAIAAQSRGAVVSGSDLAETSYLARLRARAIPVTVPHAGSAVPAGAELVYSAVVPESNVERRRADALGLRQRPRGELLAELVSDRPTVAVAGTHGKTTTTAMIAHCLRAADPGVGYLVGGDLLGTGGNADWGDERTWLVVETDESDRSALFLRPDIGVLTNVDHDHVKTFRTVGDDYAHGRDLVEPLLGPGTVCLVLGCGPVERFSSLLLRAGTTDRGEDVTG